MCFFKMEAWKKREILWKLKNIVLVVTIIMLIFSIFLMVNDKKQHNLQDSKRVISLMQMVLYDSLYLMLDLGYRCLW